MVRVSLGKWSIQKYERGFQIIWNGDPQTASCPWIPKWYFKPLYPWAIWKSVRAMKRIRNAYVRV